MSDHGGPFDDVLEAEEKMKVSGYECGYPLGRAQGLADGFATGFTQGVQLAQEVGWYLGLAECMLQAVGSSPNPDTQTVPQERAKRVLVQLVECISQFHCLQVSSSSYQEQLTKIRTKFKQAASLLKIDPPQQTHKTMDF